MKKKLNKFINITKKDGLLKSFKRSYKYLTGNFIRVNVLERIKYNRKKDDISLQLDTLLLSKHFDRIIVFYKSFGWNVPMFQRPQQIAKSLTNKKCLVLYEVTSMTDDIDFIKKEAENLYLFNNELGKFGSLLLQKLKKVKKPKYLQLYSTCWDVKREEVDMYINIGFNILYEYIDDLNPVLAGIEKLPQNVINIHDYVCKNKNVLVVTSATNLYDDILKKRGNKKNIILSSNGVDIDHFLNVSNKKIEEMENIKNTYDKIVGYYGALASWFDYDLVKKIAVNNPEIAFVLIGIKYDTSFDKSQLENIKNIIFLGPVDYKILPDYAKYFDIAWIPFVINEITLATNPIKVFEYMALKKLIITSDLPECRKYESVKIAKKYEDYENYIKNAEELMNNKYLAILEKEAKENSWDSKAEDIINLIELAKQ